MFAFAMCTAVCAVVNKPFQQPQHSIFHSTRLTPFPPGAKKFHPLQTTTTTTTQHRLTELPTPHTRPHHLSHQPPHTHTLTYTHSTNPPFHTHTHTIHTNTHTDGDHHHGHAPPLAGHQVPQAAARHHGGGGGHPARCVLLSVCECVCECVCVRCLVGAWFDWCCSSLSLSLCTVCWCVLFNVIDPTHPPTDTTTNNNNNNNNNRPVGVGAHSGLSRRGLPQGIAGVHGPGGQLGVSVCVCVCVAAVYVRTCLWPLSSYKTHQSKPTNHLPHPPLPSPSKKHTQHTASSSTSSSSAWSLTPKSSNGMVKKPS
jgi:hypothetical protein